MPHIWIVEDDEDIRDIVLYAIRSASFEAMGFESGIDFFEMLNKNDAPKPNMVILDIMLPGGWSDASHPARPCSQDDGLTILKKLRQDPKYKSLPIMMLTAKGSEHDKVKGLDLGADDYLTKPFGVMELISRIKSLLRRSNFTETQEHIYLNIRMNHTNRTVFVDNEVVALTYKEYELLNYLLINKNIVLKRDKILESVWGYDYEGESRTLDMHIKRLRQKLGRAGEHIITIRNVGYKMGE